MVYFIYFDEFFVLDEQGGYSYDYYGCLVCNLAVEVVIKCLCSYFFVILENQMLIIDSVNDDENMLWILQCEMKCLGVNNYYFFQCWEIEGYCVFVVLVECFYQLYCDSQYGLFGIECLCFLLLMEVGKMEVVGLIDLMLEFVGFDSDLVNVLVDGLIMF